MANLTGKSAIVLGASSGLGYGIALRFVQDGANVIAGARRMEHLEKLKTDAAQRGFSGRVIPVACDVLNEDDLDKVVKLCADELGKIEILACIAQAGLDSQHPTMETNKENALVHFSGGPLYTLLMVQKCMPYFEKQHYGRIITCASGAGVSPTVGFTAYSMAKAGIVALTRLFAKEFGKFGVTANCVLPVTTSDAFQNSEQGKAALEMAKKAIPVGYMGDPYTDASPVVSFLASEEAGYINSQFINIDGGVGCLI